MSPLLSVNDLAVSFVSPSGGKVRAVDGVSFTVHPRQTLAIVGESGSGKSVSAMTVLRLLPSPPAVVERGSIVFHDERAGESEGARASGAGVDLLKLSEKDMRRIRGGRIAMIFQEPMTSLNPVYTVGEQIVEAILLHQRVGHGEAVEVAAKAMEDVGIREPRERLRSYPHQLSGGMRQRVMIAMALACRPSVLLADEPTTALDVTIQAQILELLREIREQRGMGVVLITHSLGVVAEAADAACVMYAGRVVEYASVGALFERPLHPYTRGLLRCAPTMTTNVPRLTTVREVVENPADFEKLGAEYPGMVAWWPGNAMPRGVRAEGGANGEYILHEVEPGHWVGLWRTEAVAGVVAKRPDVGLVAESAAGG